MNSVNSVQPRSGVSRNPENDPNAPEEKYIQAELRKHCSPMWSTAAAQASTPQLLRAWHANADKPVLQRDLAVKLRERGVDPTSAAPSGAPTSEPASAELVVADGPFSADDKLRGEQLTEAFRQAKGAVADGTKKALVVGAMMSRQKALCGIDSARGVNSGRGRFAKGSGFKAWLAECAPEVAASEATAYRWMELAEGVHEALQLGKKVGLDTLLAQAGDEVVEGPLRKKLRELLDMIEGKSQRQLQLMLDLGPGKPRGGRREKQGPEETPEEKAAREHAALRDLFLTRFAGVGYATQDALWRHMEDVEVESAIDAAEEFITGARAWLKLTKAQRAATVVGRGA